MKPFTTKQLEASTPPSVAGHLNWPVTQEATSHVMSITNVEADTAFAAANCLLQPGPLKQCQIYCPPN